MSDQPHESAELTTDDDGLEAGLAAAFGRDSGAPVGASVLGALRAGLSAVPRVRLRDAERPAESPVVRPSSSQMPRDPTAR